MTFAVVLKQARRRAKITRMELCRRSGLDLSEVAHLEQGRRKNPRLDTITKLANGLGVDVATLIGENGR